MRFVGNQIKDVRRSPFSLFDGKVLKKIQIEKTAKEYIYVPLMYVTYFYVQWDIEKWIDNRICFEIVLADGKRLGSSQI